VSKCDIEILFDKADRTFHGGDTISGQAVIRVNQDINCNGIILNHYWSTHGKGNTRTGEKQTIRLSEIRPLQAGDELRLPFEFESELWPVTYRGTNINVDHYVHVAVDVPWAIDPKHSEEYIVLAGRRPPQFTGDRSEVVELKADPKKSVEAGLFLKLSLAPIIVMVLVALVMFAAFLIPLAAIGGAIYWFRKKAISGRVGEVELLTPVMVVGSDETWPCTLSFTPRKTFRINEISVHLLVQESATSGSGTNSTTHTHTLYDQKEVIRDAGQLISGEPFFEELRIPLPDTDAWSLDIDDNKLSWVMDVRIDIPRCPDWSRKLTLQMIPSEFLTDTGSPSLEAMTSDDPTTHEATTETTPQSDSASLFDLMSAINGADRYGNERSQVISAAGDKVFDVTIIVDRISTTLGMNDDLGEAHRQGRTILGTIAGTKQEVQLFAQQANNSHVDAVARNEVWECKATVQKWDSLYNRLVMLEV